MCTMRERGETVIIKSRSIGKWDKAAIKKKANGKVDKLRICEVNKKARKK